VRSVAKFSRIFRGCERFGVIEVFGIVEACLFEASEHEPMLEHEKV
jgi:hypothetical protein